MIFTAPPELTTSITDLILGLLSLFCFIKLQKADASNKEGKRLWLWVFGLLSFNSIYGAILHGFIISPKALEIAWYPLSFTLGLLTSLFAVVFWFQWRGVKALKTAIITMSSLCFLFFITLYILSKFIPQYFIIFIVYSSLTILFSLVISLKLTIKDRKQSSKFFSIGIILMIIASVLQALRIEPFTIIWKFDHNTLYHTVMMIALYFLYRGSSIFINSLDS